MSRTLKELASSPLQSASPETTVTQAAQLMRNQHVGALLVVDPATQQPQGLLTDRDLVLAVLAEGLDPDTLTVADLMSRTLISLPAQANLLDAIACMRQQGLRRVLVRDEFGGLFGIVTLEDVIEGLASELTQLALALREARDRERQQRQ